MVNVYVSADMFSNDATRVSCPYCGKGNVLPLCAINQDVECGSCDRSFHVQLTRSRVTHTKVSATGGSAKKIWAIISLICSIIFFIWLSPYLLGVFREVTGTDLGLGKMIYSDDDCRLECMAAVSENDYGKAMKWARRIRDERVRRICVSAIQDAEKIDKSLKEIQQEIPFAY